MNNITAINGDMQVECPKCYSLFHKGFLPFHLTKCLG